MHILYQRRLSDVCAFFRSLKVILLQDHTDNIFLFLARKFGDTNRVSCMKFELIYVYNCHQLSIFPNNFSRIYLFNLRAAWFITSKIIFSIPIFRYLSVNFKVPFSEKTMPNCLTKVKTIMPKLYV